MPKLVTGIGDGQGLGPFGDAVTGEDLHALFACKRARIQSQCPGQIHIHLDETRSRYWCWVQSSVEALRHPRIGVFKAEFDTVAFGPRIVWPLDPWSIR